MIVGKDVLNVHITIIKQLFKKLNIQSAFSVT